MQPARQAWEEGFIGRLLIEALARQAAFSLYQIRNLNTRLRAKDLDVVTAVTEFASNVSHKIKAPFANIVDASVGGLAREGGPQLSGERRRRFL